LSDPRPIVRGSDKQLQSVELPSSATRRLRPAGQRPASRRLSRSPSAPERTINVLHRRRWGRTAVLSGAEAARRSHNGWPAVGLQPHASPFPAQFFAAQRAAPEISLFPLRSSIYCVTAVIAVAFTRSAVRYPIVQPHPGAAPMPRIRRGPPNAAPPRAAPFGLCYHARHPAGQA